MYQEFFESRNVTSRTYPPVKGRIKARAEYWVNTLQASDPVIRIVKQGYSLPLFQVPQAYKAPNQASAHEHAALVDDAISDLIEGGCAKQMPEVLHVCSPLSVVVGSTGKKRLVINLRYLNQYLMQKKFKYEDIKTALTLMERVSFLFTYDLKSGYHHIDIHVDSQTFLGFEWKGKYYVFTVLPFGLATCYVFTKVLRPLVRYWQGQGIKCALYLDDGIGLAANEVLARQYSEVVRCSLERRRVCSK